MASLNDFLDPDLNTADILHSSGYVSASGLGGGGGGLSMERRKELLDRPRVVGTYGRSHLGRRYSAANVRTADRKTRAHSASSDDSNGTASHNNRKKTGFKGPSKIDTSIAKRQHFIEPPRRSYDPYA